MLAIARHRGVRLLGGVVAAALTGTWLQALPAEQRIMAAVFALTVFYWITEPIPLYVTSLLAGFASAVLLGPLAPLTGAAMLDYRIFFHPFASPVVVLMFGGFVMAQVFSQHNLDIEFSQMVLRKLGSRPSHVLAGMMLITAGMSMWMSNTATTAIMVAAVLPMVRRLPPGANMARALMLAIPFSANIGGMATPIGTPPNAIAIGLLADQGIHISFLVWMLAGFPLMMLLLGMTFLLLRLFFPIQRSHFALEIGEEPIAANRAIVYTVFFVTVALWVTDHVHGVPSALIAMVPVMIFSIFGLLSKKMLREIAWDILLLIGGGIALGVGIQQTGLAESIVGAVLPPGIGAWGTMLLLGGTSALLATFMSNTAASNIILPLAVSVAVGLPEQIGIPVALCASLGMALPISTPPNAIAFGSELVAGKDMFRLGAVITILGVILTVAYEEMLYSLPLVLRLFGH